jgi:thiol-disulfide isomerase/thioredoxin
LDLLHVSVKMKKLNQILITLLVLLCHSVQVAMAQQQTQAYQSFKSKVEAYIQDDLYGKVSAVLFDVDEAPLPVDYINFSKQVKSEMNALLDKEMKDMSETEKQSAKSYIDQMMIQLGELYLERASDKEQEEKKVYYHQFLQDVGLIQGTDLITEEFGRSVMMGLHTAMELPYGISEGELNTYINQLDPASREFFGAAAIMNDMGNLVKPYAQLELDLNQFNSSFPDSRFKTPIQNNFKDLERYKEGAAVANFDFVDLQGNKVSLQDFKDKIIYLDLWASWCGPCINTFRTKTPEFEKQLRPFEDVVLMYVSIDEKQDPWKNYLSKNEMRGIHLFAGKGFEAEIMKYFKVWGIPRYLIIGKDNKIVTVNAPRPGDEAFALLSGLSAN